jgi:NAD(P)-dependent dehydrogenase (short-subunit alcohol dehydrogenase family)
MWSFITRRTRTTGRSSKRLALPHLKPGAAIIASGSQTGIPGSGGLPAYSTTKGAIHTFNKTLSESYISGEVLNVPGGTTTAG